MRLLLSHTIYIIIATHIQREEQQRQDKIEDWERHKQGQGYRGKTKAGQSSSTVKSNDYNPLMGSGGAAGGKTALKNCIKHNISHDIILTIPAAGILLYNVLIV